MIFANAMGRRVRKFGVISPGLPAFSPADVFGASDRGFAFDFTDLTKLFQNSTGIGAVVNANDPIGYATDLSGKGNHAKQATAAARPLWSSVGAICDGTKLMATAAVDFSNTSQMTIIACAQVDAAGNHSVMNLNGANVGGAVLFSGSASGNLWTATAFGSLARVDASNSRGGLSASFKVATAALDLSQAVAADEASCRINGEAYGSSVANGPGGVGPFANATVNIMSAWFGNMTGKVGRIFCIGRKLTVEETLAVEQWVGLGNGLSIISELPPVGPAYYNMWNSYGQSLSCGVQSLPILSSVARFNDKMFTGGLHVKSTGLNYSTLIPLAETEANESASPEGETPVSGAVEMLHELGHINPFICVNDGFPAAPIADLSIGTTVYNRFLDSVVYGKRRAREEFQHFKMLAFTWMQGEGDGTNNNYAANLSTLRTNLNTDIKSRTGQTEDIWCITYQLDRPKIGLAHLSASDTLPNIRVAMPMYHISHYSDGVHLSNTGSKIAGAYLGRAYKAIVLDGNTSWQPLKPLSHSTVGSICTVTFNPVGVLALDTTIVAAQANSGFKLFQSDGVTPITISSVSIVGAAQLAITANVAIPAGAILRYGFSDPESHLSNMSRGNLRDTQGDTIVFGGGGLNYPLHNWCVLFQRTVA